MNHDPLCYVAQNNGNCCPWLPECDCQCMCSFIHMVREDERNNAANLVEMYFRGTPSVAKIHVNWVRDAILRGEVDDSQ